MNPQPHVVTAIDLDDTARIALDTALRLAGPNGRITVLHIVASAAHVRKDARSASEAMFNAEPRVRAIVDRVLSRIPNGRRRRIDIEIGAGNTADQIVDLAIDVEADMIVVGTHDRHGLERIAFGSTAAEVMRRAPCTVVVAREPHYEQLTKPAHVQPPLQPGQHPRVRNAGPIGFREQRLAFYDSNVIPTGIPQRDVR